MRAGRNRQPNRTQHAARSTFRSAATLQGREGAHAEDSLLKGSEIRSAGRTWKPGTSSPTATAYRKPGNTLFGFCDAWGEMLIGLNGPSGWHLDLDQALEAADGPVRADRDTLDGRGCIRLKYSLTYRTGAKSNVTQWHDVGRNYLICQLISEHANGPTSRRGVARVTDFIEPSPGVIFPVRVQRNHYKDGELLFQAGATTLTEVVINKPVPASALALPPLPPGTILYDRIENKEGPIGSDWKPIGPMKPLAPRIVPAAEQAPPARPADTAPSAAEPASPARWVVAGSVAALVAAAGLAVVRHFRAGRRPAA